MSLFEEINRAQKKDPFPSSEEAKFYNDHSYLLGTVDAWSNYLKATDSFKIIRANIILKGLLNKKSIEKSLKFKANQIKKEENTTSVLNIKEFMDDATSTLPFFEHQGKKIFIPFFPLSFNRLYSDEHYKFEIEPYKKMITDFSSAVIDPFDYYGKEIYESHFTRLVTIKKDDKCLCAYDFDAEALYFINNQGRLDVRIAFFDKYLKRPTRTHMITRVEKVAEAYFNNDKEGLKKALVDNKLISKTLMEKIEKKEKKR